jgi:hypothetical protein
MGNGSQLGSILRDPKQAADFTAFERGALRQKHSALISQLEERGDALMPPGSMGIRHPVTGVFTTSPSQMMAELTVATQREVALVRVGDQRLLRLGFVDEIGPGVRLRDAKRVVAHTHPSGELRFSPEDIAVFLEQTKQKRFLFSVPSADRRS